jgi:hypothetical protein
VLKAEVAEAGSVHSLSHEAARPPAYKDRPRFAASEINEATVRQLHRGSSWLVPERRADRWPWDWQTHVGASPRRAGCRASPPQGSLLPTIEARQHAWWKAKGKAGQLAEASSAWIS